MRDYQFNPTPLYLVPGETVHLRLFNGGLVEHELVLGDAAVQAAWTAADTGGVRVVLASGASADVTYEVPRGVQLELVCHLPGHVEQGMIGEVLLANR